MTNAVKTKSKAMSPAVKEVRKEMRRLAKIETKELAIIAAHKAQKPVKEMTITIEWKKSRTWGANPSATAEIRYHDGTYGHIGPASCSGCGYDKESTVIADLFNAALRYKLYEVINGQAPYGMYYYNGEATRETYTDRDGKAQLYYKKPTYNGGVGTSCYYSIAEFIGGKFERVAGGKSFDVYKYTDGK